MLSTRVNSTIITVDGTPPIIDCERASSRAQLVWGVHPTSLSRAILTHTLAPYPFLADVHDVFMSTVPTLGGREADLVGATSLEIGTLFSSRDSESGIRDASWCLGSFPGACDVMPLRAVEHALRESQQSSE